MSFGDVDVILISTLESTACIEEATAVCTDCVTIGVSADIPAEGEGDIPMELGADVMAGVAVYPSGVAICGIRKRRVSQSCYVDDCRV